jgi:hypothetical protein
MTRSSGVTFSPHQLSRFYRSDFRRRSSDRENGMQCFKVRLVLEQVTSIVPLSSISKPDDIHRSQALYLMQVVIRE